MPSNSNSKQARNWVIWIEVGLQITLESGGERTREVGNCRRAGGTDWRRIQASTTTAQIVSGVVISRVAMVGSHAALRYAAGLPAGPSCSSAPSVLYARSDTQAPVQVSAYPGVLRWGCLVRDSAERVEGFRPTPSHPLAWLCPPPYVCLCLGHLLVSCPTPLLH